MSDDEDGGMEGEGERRIPKKKKGKSKSQIEENKDLKQKLNIVILWLIHTLLIQH